MSIPTLHQVTVIDFPYKEHVLKFRAPSLAMLTEYSAEVARSKETIGQLLIKYIAKLFLGYDEQMFSGATLKDKEKFVSELELDLKQFEEMASQLGLWEGATQKKTNQSPKVNL